MPDEKFKPRIGVDLGGTKIEAIVLDGFGEILARERMPSPQDNYDATVSAVSELVRRVCAGLGLDPDLPIGIGTPGAVSLKTGMMKNCNSTVLNGKPLSDDLAAHHGAPVRIANDANCFTLSEASDGAGQSESLTFGVILGTGVGGGICFNGSLLTGINAICGEWGHNTLPLAALQPDANDQILSAPDRRCYCGRTNCVETWLSGPAFERSWAAKGQPSLTSREIVELVDAGDHHATAALNQYCNLLALGLSTVINILDPAVIVLGGGMSNVDALYRRVHYFLPRYVFSDQVTTSIRRARHGDSSGVRGAAWLWSIEEIYG